MGIEPRIQVTQIIAATPMNNPRILNPRLSSSRQHRATDSGDADHCCHAYEQSAHTESAAITSSSRTPAYPLRVALSRQYTAADSDNADRIAQPDHPVAHIPCSPQRHRTIRASLIRGYHLLQPHTRIPLTRRAQPPGEGYVRIALPRLDHKIIRADLGHVETGVAVRCDLNQVVIFDSFQEDWFQRDTRLTVLQMGHPFVAETHVGRFDGVEFALAVSSSVDHC